jgi:(1->4)-alpha-D-glucan 1-alpha-D-glucosylmutase
VERALAEGTPAVTPSATYRVQFNAAFTFRDAIEIVPYLADLGVTHLYASPILRARPGSMHGYDIIDHNAFNPEIGSADDFAELVRGLRDRGLGMIIDFVPNHMGIGPENRWWLDVLEWGEASPYATYFDIDWHPLRSGMTGKVLLPFLGEQYGEALAARKIRLGYQRPAGFVLQYSDLRFPVTPPTYATILRAAHNPELTVLAEDFARLSRGLDGALRPAGRELVDRLAELAKEQAVLGDLEAAVATFNDDPQKLDGLIGGQHYRISYWRVASDEINYRRFFDINALAGLRTEDAQCFADTHRLIFELLARRDIDGLRIDHVDGLFDPLGYCDLLKSRAELFGLDLYLVVEKILARHETLRERWRVDGTTGYEYLALILGQAIDADSEKRMDRLYRRFSGETKSFAEIAYESRKLIMATALAGELNVLAQRLDRIAQQDRKTRDYTLYGLRDALEEVVACFPVYRTYNRAGQIDDDDRRDIEWAVGRARKRDELREQSIYDFICDVLTTVGTTDPTPLVRERVNFAMRFQQFTAPVTAKAVEDTAYYRYHRLDALNEVGCSPSRFGTSVAAFHHSNVERSRKRPHGMLSTATHDTKRGEDTRMRLAVLSEIPRTWARSVGRWAQLNARRRIALDGRPAPDRNDEYFIYQTLVGAWPPELCGESFEAELLAPFVERLEHYFVKALRESKARSSWIHPNTEYEEAVLTFVRRILDVSRRSPFLEDFRRFACAAARFGAYNGLSQAVLRVMGPGVPDTYQGAELWDLTLVDPDNRRPVDFAQRRRLLADLRQRRASGDGPALCRSLLETWRDGRIKLYVLWRLLDWRRAHPEAFERGAYAPLETGGRFAEHVLAFRMGEALAVTSRLLTRMLGDRNDHPTGALWDDSFVTVDDEREYTDVFSGAQLRATGGRLALAAVCRDLPVAVLEPAH